MRDDTLPKQAANEEDARAKVLVGNAAWFPDVGENDLGVWSELGRAVPSMSEVRGSTVSLIDGINMRFPQAVRALGWRSVPSRPTQKKPAGRPAAWNSIPDFPRS